MSENPAKKRPPMKTIGSMSCPCCDREVPLKEQANGLAAVSCSWCGYQSYARGEESDRLMRTKMAGAATKVSPTPKATTPPPPPAASKVTVKKTFMEDL